MKEYKKIILINIILITVVFIVAEIFCYLFSVYELYKNMKQNNIPLETINYRYNFKMQSYDEYFQNSIKNSFRSPVGLNYTKKPILIFGCSYAYGLDLQEEETFSYKLSKYAKRPVYNRGICGGSIQHSILQAQEDSFYNEIEEPEYAIFVQQSRWQLLRLYYYVYLLWDDMLYPRFVEKNNDLIKVKDIPFFSGLYLIKVFYHLKSQIMFHNQFNDENMNFLVLHFKKLKEEIQKHWKNTKFVVLFYYQEVEPEEFDTKLKKKLIENGFIVVNTRELTGISLCGEQYQLSKQDEHPNAKAWDVVVPKLVKALNL